MDHRFSSRARRSTKLQDELNIENPNFSDSDLNYEARKNIGKPKLTSLGNNQNWPVQGKATENEELVKYMSNLPSYLEKGGNLKEKALNFGVLDWRRLEKWQHKQMSSCQSSKHSPSSSRSARSSSFFSTDGSSAWSSIDQSFSPAHQRMRRPSLQSYLNASPAECYSPSPKNVKENFDRFQDLKAAPGNSAKGGKHIFRMYHSCSNNQSDINANECSMKDRVPEHIPETEISIKDPRPDSHSKGKIKIQDGESTDGTKEFQKPSIDVTHNCLEKGKSVVHLPRTRPEICHSATSYSNSAVNGQRSTEARGRNYLKESFLEEVFDVDPYFDIPYSCPLPSEDGNARHLQMTEPSPIDVKNTKFSSVPSQPHARSIKISTTTKYSEASSLKIGTTVASRSRNSSPTHQFSIGHDRMDQHHNSEDGSVALQASTKHIMGTSGSQKAALTCLENSFNDEPSSTGRSLSSPLRRLLDLLLNPKAVNSHHPAVQSERDLTSTVRSCKSSNGRVESSSTHSIKVNSVLTSSKTINADASRHKEKDRSSTVQALLQIAITNGLPLFTFTDEIKGDILAATLKKVNASKKDDNSWIYTFFNVHEVKRKNNWINQGSKGKTHSYIPNIVAQMTVSDAWSGNLIGQRSVDELGIREFVLFAVDQRKADQCTSDLHPNDELAAIVVKSRKGTHRSLNKEVQQTHCIVHPSMTGQRESLPQVSGCAYSEENKENGALSQSQECSATVILPGGVHGLPSKGEPSPLIARWKSGGLCDCGGWDMGCSMTVLASRTKPRRVSTSSKLHSSTDRFELFSQGEVPDGRPVLTLGPFKDNIFSVQFNSSLPFLQAFAICMAVLNSRKPYELSELSKLFEEKYSEAPNTQAELAASYASNPPPSPVGRV
ncbi:uncharacterized protein LOC127808765 [Diospyros lotus]|uniref:uncharacterized protein LOC127808765 n=1 Tax=Diospyros lotus TaxID=55363 RepID=UPI00224FEF00|nr:uncharacterized protein LOC127808765 [Diospyros lotus]XP_052203338.1 uncharacterized protein LOC127808765 [Diospyros lotus]XP_052203346.1 uncharacterized protein LOC127808765 [Diospyros lotus]